MRNQLVSGAIGALGIIACLVAYVVKGSIPDVLATLTSVSVGGYFGVTVPAIPKV